MKALVMLMLVVVVFGARTFAVNKAGKLVFHAVESNPFVDCHVLGSPSGSTLNNCFRLLQINNKPAVSTELNVLNESVGPSNMNVLSGTVGPSNMNVLSGIVGPSNMNVLSGTVGRSNMNVLSETVGPSNMNVLNGDQKALLYLFERPFEPLTVPRGRAGEQIIFQEERAQVGFRTAARSESSNLMNIPSNIMKFPSISPYIMNKLQLCSRVKKGKTFSQFNPLHKAAAKELTQLFMEPQIKDMRTLWKVAASVKDRLNEELFIYALSFAIIRNPAFDSRLVPAIYEVFPNKFIPQDIRHQAIKVLSSTQYTNQECDDDNNDADNDDEDNGGDDNNDESLPEEIVVSHDINFTGNDLNHEHRVAYWREDYGINSHHWHWHLLFPLSDTRYRNRKGELFFYMHNQLSARYDWERLSNRLNRVVKLNNWREPIPEGYFSKLTTTNSFRNYGARPENMIPQRFTRLDKIDDLFIPFDITDMERWRERLFDAIHNNYMMTENGTRQPLSDNVGPGEKRGIDILSDAVEADEDLSINAPFYGSLHNTGHDMIAFIHDPHGYHNEELGVMGDATTALRDPIFYRWHRFIDDLFQEYKLMQDPYEDNELAFDSVTVESVSVKSEELDENVLETGWANRRIEVSRGLDFQSSNRSIMVDLQHLTHTDFTYNIKVKNNKFVPVNVTVRLYMAPKHNEAGSEMTFMDQRLLWAEMDRYHTTLQPGSNSLERLSTESSITIPGEMTFRDLEQNPPNDTDPTTAVCGCGWPQHLLLPMGKPEGMEFQIFVLISDWELDKVEESPGKKTCSKAASICGILDAEYPDARPMGYPFDRRPNNIVINRKNAMDFANSFPNAFMTDIKIYFRGTFLQP